MCEENVREEDEYAGADHGVGGGLSHLYRTALHGIAEEGGDAGDDEGEEEALDDAHPHEPRVEGVLQTQCQVVGREDMSHVGGGVGADDAHGRTEDDEEGHEGDQSHYLGQDEVAGGVDAHDVKGVDLLGDAHRTEFRGDVRPHLTGQYQAHDARGELQQHDFSGGVSRHPARHPGALDVQFHLDTDHGADEEGDEQYDADGVDAQLRHLLDVLF